MQDAGMVRQAAELYYQALRKKPSYIEAMVGLRSAGQGVVDTWVGEFQQASMDGRRKDALGLYDNMTAYTQRMSKVDVDLIIPTTIRITLHLRLQFSFIINFYPNNNSL